MISRILRRLARLLRHERPKETPSGSAVVSQAFDEFLRLNVKNFGYELARQLEPVLSAVDRSQEPRKVGLVSKPTTQADMESPWFAHWCAELKAQPLYHRKLWEFAFLLQALYEHGLLREGVKGIGFGCGREPLASYIASQGKDAVVTDLAPEKAAGLGWMDTAQHATTLAMSSYPDIVSPELFQKHVKHRYVDMNHIPNLDEEYDFCWSVCAMEHVGSIALGLDFVERSLSVLRTGGLAIHTTEFNYLSKDDTVEQSPSTVLFLRKHFEQLAERLLHQGHKMLGPDFHVGDGVLDRYIDLPPFFLKENARTAEQWGNVHPAHLKLAVDRYACTCYGILVEKDGACGKR